MSRKESRLFVSGFSSNIDSRELEDLFYEIGKISFSDIHNGKGYIVNII